MSLFSLLWSSRISIFKFALFRRLVVSLFIITFVFGLTGIVWMNYYFENLILDYAGNLSADSARLILETFDQRLDEKIFAWRAYFNDEKVKAEIATANEEFSKLANIDDLIRTRDAAWVEGKINEDQDEWYGQVLNGPASIELQELAARDNYTQVGHFGIGEIFVTNKFGVTAFTNRKTTDYYQADEEWWQKAKQDGLFISQVEYDESAGLYGVTISFRIDDTNGSPLGVAKVFYNLKEAEMTMESILQTRLRQSQVQSGLIGGLLVDQNLKAVYALGASDFNDLHQSTLKKMEAENKGYFCCAIEPVSGESKEVILALAKSRGHDNYPGIGWGLVLEFEKDVLIAPLRSFLVVILAVVLIICILFFFFSLFFFAPIVGTITKLELAMSKVVRGDLSVRTKIVGNDELGRLAGHFDQMVAQLEDASRARQEFISTATHGLKAPLTGIKWNLEILFDENKGQKLPAAVRKTLREIYGTCTQMIATVSDVLRVNKLNRLNGRARATEFDPADFLTSIKSSLEVLAKGRNRELRFVIGGESMKILMDKDVFKDIVENLVSNAVKYSSAGSQVEIRLHKKDGLMQLEVEDHGIGIPTQEQKNLFQEFYRASNAVGKQIEGSGLGLYIAKSEAQFWGGDLTFVSKENQGSTFSLTIPLKN